MSKVDYQNKVLPNILTDVQWQDITGKQIVTLNKATVNEEYIYLSEQW